MNTKREAKIVWFMLRTGCTKIESIKWLTEAKFKLEIAIRLRRDQYARN